MRKIAIGLLAGAGALMAGNANASDIYTTSENTNSDLVQQVRMVCNDDWTLLSQPRQQPCNCPRVIRLCATRSLQRASTLSRLG